jgi:type IV pilus assembly protein PilW
MMQIKPTCNKEQGFSLVEMMVAMLISLILLAGVSQIYLSSRQSYRMQESLSRVQENGRFALEFLSRDIRMSDFWGCANFDSVTNNLNPAGVTPDLAFDEGGLSADDGTGLNGSDVITLRGAYPTNMNVLPNGAAGYGPLQSSDITIGNNNNLSQCDIVIVADCSRADIFQINNANPGGTGELVHNTGTTCSPSNYNTVSCTGGNAHCLSKIYAGDASVYRMQQVVYSLGVGGQGEPALYRKENGNAAIELVDGIADFQIRYGEDIDGDLAADYYVPANQVVDMGRVVSVRVWVLARSYEDNLTPTRQTYEWETQPVQAADNRLYQVFTSTIALRNRTK